MRPKIGVKDHFQQAMASSKDFSALGAWAGELQGVRDPCKPPSSIPSGSTSDRAANRATDDAALAGS